MEMEQWLCMHFAVGKQQDWPVAPLSLEPFAEGYWLCADPVHLRLSRDQLVLFDAGQLAISMIEAEKIVSDLNRHFAADGFHFVAASPECWLLRLPQAPQIATTPLAQVAGKHVDPFLPKGADSLKWHHTLNEIQMFLYTHPLNDEREMAGKQAINSLWLWGGGVLPEAGNSAFASVAAQNPFARGIAGKCGSTPLPLPENAGDWLSGLPSKGEHLAVLETARFPAIYGDFGQWEKALLLLEKNWFAPLLQALKEKKIENLLIISLGPEKSLQFAASPQDLWKFWRQAKPLASYS